MPFSLIPGRADVACGPQHVALTPVFLLMILCLASSAQVFRCHGRNSSRPPFCSSVMQLYGQMTLSLLVDLKNRTALG